MALQEMSLQAYKSAAGITKLEIKRNASKGTWFAVTDTGHTLRVHQATDWATKPKSVVVLVPDGVLEDACLCPAGLGAPTVASY